MRREGNFYQKKQSDVKDRDRMKQCPNTIEKKHVVENNNVAVTDLLLLGCTKTWELAFAGCFVSCCREYLNLQPTSLGAARNGSRIFLSLLGDWGCPLNSSAFDIA